MNLVTLNRIFVNRSARTVALIKAGMLCGVWIVAGALVLNERQKVEQDALKDAANYARIFEEHTARTIQSVDQTARFVKRAYEADPRRFDLNQFLGDSVPRGGTVVLVTLVDENGDVVQSTKPFSPVNLSDRDHVRVHMSADTGKLFISKPVLGRVSGKWSIQLTRRINKPDGSFGGVVVVSMDPFYFTGLYRDIDISEHGAIFVFADDGIIRARRSGGVDSIGQDLRNGNLFNMALRANAGTLRSRSRLDDTERFYAFRRLEGYPLYVGVGLGVEDELKSYDEYRNMMIIMAGITTVVILVTAAILMRVVEQLEASRRKAVEANEAKSRFLANMSHELRTPLNGIPGFAELLELDLAGTPQEEFAHSISHSGEHLLSLVNSVLDLAKVEAGKMTLHLAAQDVSEVVRHTIDGHLSSAMKKHLDLRFELDPALPRRSLLDRMRLVQVLNNLIHNAIKFTEKGVVKITASMERDGVLFDIADTGPGIDPAIQKTLFQKFVQADGSEQRHHEGTGLGLALARELVELMGGRIWLESEPGKGSHFKFTLPVAAA